MNQVAQKNWIITTKDRPVKIFRLTQEQKDQFDQLMRQGVDDIEMPGSQWLARSRVALAETEAEYESRAGALPLRDFGSSLPGEVKEMKMEPVTKTVKDQFGEENEVVCTNPDGSIMMRQVKQEDDKPLSAEKRKELRERIHNIGKPEKKDPDQDPYTMFRVDNMLMPRSEFVKYARRKGYKGIRAGEAIAFLAQKGIKVTFGKDEA